jgi:YbgC/YbaW family acyl-CoA thioester hydrolase
MFVVTRAALDYHLPARLDDELTVTARPRAVRGASLSLEQRVYRRAELLVAGEVTIACVDPRGLRPRRIPADMLATLRGALAAPGE